MSSDGVDLSDLNGSVRGLGQIDPGVLITDVTHDSRRAGPGVLFVAVRGERHDGHAFVDAAIAAGSPAIVVEASFGRALPVPTMVVADSRAVLGILADAIYGHPSKHLSLVGVTGTNGKTTVTHMVAAIGRAAGLRTAYAGTVGARIVDDVLSMDRTTPEAPEFQRLLARMVAEGVELAAVEVSSHGLALGRVTGTVFSIAAFTNLSQDHLDLHGDMGSYFEAKRSLFDHAAHAVVCVDDEWGRTLAGGLEIPTTTVGFTGADVTGAVRRLGFGGSTVAVSTPEGTVDMTVPIAGRFNVSNALVAAAIARVAGIGWDTIAAGVAAVSAVPGRFELVETGRDFTVVVDYAHTPEGIEASIAAARDILDGTGRVIAVAGAGGDRDRAKRPLMGRAASKADVVVITTDNPRGEDPGLIIDEVSSGLVGAAQSMIEPDRRRAIAWALGEAREGDAVLILGKGHESVQEIGTETFTFDDRVVAREEAAAL